MKLPVGTFTVRVDSLESFPSGSRFFLEDKGLPIGRDSLQDLLVNNTYAFSYNGPYQEIRTRFVIHCIAPRVGLHEPLHPSSNRLEAFLHPSPASERLSVRLVGARGPVRYRVLTAAGTVALDGMAGAASFALDVKGLPRGLYLLVAEEKGRSATKRFVKE